MTAKKASELSSLKVGLGEMQRWNINAKDLNSGMKINFLKKNQLATQSKH